MKLLASYRVPFYALLIGGGLDDGFLFLVLLGWSEILRWIREVARTADAQAFLAEIDRFTIDGRYNTNSTANLSQIQRERAMLACI